jgi:hypothetical protein
MAAIARTHRGQGRSHGNRSVYLATDPEQRRLSIGRGFALATTLLTMFVAGCASVSEQPEHPSVAIPTPEQPVDSGEFTVAENMLDTWNTIGKILVTLEGVRYEGRSQMLGLYTVRYHGEPFLIRTRAVAIDDASQGISTRVDALDSTGKPFTSPASVALLRILAERIPQEVAQYRQPVKLPSASKKRKKK